MGIFSAAACRLCRYVLQNDGPERDGNTDVYICKSRKRQGGWLLPRHTAGQALQLEQGICHSSGCAAKDATTVFSDAGCPSVRPHLNAS